MDGTLWEAVAAIAAVVSIIGAGISWFLANGSKSAKRSAEEARDRAERLATATEKQASYAQERADAAAEQVSHLESMLAEFRRQADSLQRIASASAPPPFEVSHVKGVLYRLKNNTNSEVVIEQIDNRAKFLRLDYLDDGTAIDAGDSVEFRAGGASGLPLPARLQIGFLGEDAPVLVELPPRPPK